MHSRRAYGCPVEFSLDVLGGKWKTVILARLKQGPLRYSELRKAIPSLSDKMLTGRLHEMCDVGLIEVAPDDADGRRYRITDMGASLAPVLHALYEWGQKHAPSLGAQVRAGC